LGLTYKKWGKYPLALELYKEALEMRVKELGNLHPDVVATKHNLGELYLSLGDQENANKYMYEALEIIKM